MQCLWNEEVAYTLEEFHECSVSFQTSVLHEQICLWEGNVWICGWGGKCAKLVGGMESVQSLRVIGVWAGAHFTVEPDVLFITNQLIDDAPEEDSTLQPSGICVDVRSSPSLAIELLDHFL